MSTPDVCPCCGLPSETVEKKLYSKLGVDEVRILKMVRGAGKLGISTAAIYARLYGGRSEPPTMNLVAVRCSHLNRKLAHEGLRIVSRPRSGVNSLRYLETIDAPKTTERRRPAPADTVTAACRPLDDG